jgi:hypothetical protein
VLARSLPRFRCYTETVNVTISLPEDIVRRARHAAVDQGMSLSKYVATVVERSVTGGLTYEEAKRRFFERLDKGPLYEVGEITWTRDDLHDRRL